MIETNTLWLIVAMAVTTFLCRAILLLVSSDRRLPVLVERGLDHVPIGVLTAIIVVPLLPKASGETILLGISPFMVGTVVAFLAACLSRNLFLVVGAGAAAVALARTFIQ